MKNPISETYLSSASSTCGQIVHELVHAISTIVILWFVIYAHRASADKGPAFSPALVVFCRRKIAIQQSRAADDDKEYTLRPARRYS